MIKSAVLASAVLAVCVAGTVGLFWGFTLAVDFLVGAAVVTLPNMWVVAKGFFGRPLGTMIALGLTKYALAGLGFAVWFAVAPDSNALLVLAGSATVLLITPIAVHLVAGRQHN